MPRMPRRVRSSVLTSIVLIALSGCSVWTPKPSVWSNATGGEQFERLWWQSVKSRDWTQVEGRLASGYVAQSSEVTKSKDEAVAHLKQLEISDFSLGDFDVRPAGDSMIVTYTLDLRGSLAGQPVSLTQSRMMTVWQQQKRGWVAIAHSGELP
jgi:hypothetical protein